MRRGAAGGSYGRRQHTMEVPSNRPRTISLFWREKETARKEKERGAQADEERRRNKAFESHIKGECS